MRFFQSHRSILIVPWLIDFSGFMIVFAVQRGLAEADVGMARMGLVGAILPASLGMTCLISGWLSDRLGRRRMILTGIALVLVGVSVVTLGVYELAYMLCGTGLGMVYPPCVAWLTQGRSSAGARSAMSRILILFCISWNLGMMSGQVCGGWLFAIDPTWPLIGSASLAVVAMIVVFLSRDPAAISVDAVGPVVEVDVTHRAQAALFARFSRVANLGGAFAMSTVFYLFPKTAVDLGIESDVHGLLLGMTRVVIISIYFLMHLTSFWHFRLVTTLGAQCLAAVGMVGMALAPNVFLVMLALIATAQVQGYNYFAGLYYSTAGSSDQKRGASSGFHEATISGGIALGSLVGGLVGEHGHPRLPYAFAAGVILVMIVFQLVLWWLMTRTNIAAKPAEAKSEDNRLRTQ